MSKEEEFKLLSKEEIEKERIKAYEYIDMSKEQTPLTASHFLYEKKPISGRIMREAK